jgi:hypothetical protein
MSGERRAKNSAADAPGPDKGALRVVILLAVSVMAVTTACAKSRVANTTPVASPLTTTTQSNVPAVDAGILIESVADESALKIGSIEPTTGRYSEFATFNLYQDQDNNDAADGVGIQLSPDYTRYAISLKVGAVTEVGWIDRTGKFVDVTNGTPPVATPSSPERDHHPRRGGA